jgi:transcriptional regulator GlxA family with amidase domain
VLVPALGAKMPDALAARLARADVRDAMHALQQWAHGGAAVGAACTGTFVVAESGLLDGERATTSWWLAPMFRQRYPAIALDESRMLVQSSRVTTAGAAMAHLDLALGLLRKRSPALAALAARYLLVEARGSQAEYVIPDHLAHSDPVVERFEAWARRKLAKGFSLAEAARAAGASERTLARRLQSTLGKTPLSYFQDLRVERAVHLLRTGNARADQIATQIGYAAGVTLRSLLRRKLGRGVRELRARADESLARARRARGEARLATSSARPAAKRCTRDPLISACVNGRAMPIMIALLRPRTGLWSVWYAFSAAYR